MELKNFTISDIWNLKTLLVYSLPMTSILFVIVRVFSNQMQLSKKQKTFSGFSARFMKSISNFEHFEKNDDTHS